MNARAKSGPLAGSARPRPVLVAPGTDIAKRTEMALGLQKAKVSTPNDLQIDPKKQLGLFVLPTCQAAILDSYPRGVSLAEGLNTWLEDARSMLAAIKSTGAQTLVISYDFAVHRPVEVRGMLQERWGLVLEDGQSIPDTDGTDPILAYFANETFLSSSPARRAQAEFDALSPFDLRPDSNTGAAPSLEQMCQMTLDLSRRVNESEDAANELRVLLDAEMEAAERHVREQDRLLRLEREAGQTAEKAAMARYHKRDMEFRRLDADTRIRIDELENDLAQEINRSRGLARNTDWLRIQLKKALGVGHKFEVKFHDAQKRQESLKDELDRIHRSRQWRIAQSVRRVLRIGRRG